VAAWPRAGTDAAWWPAVVSWLLYYHDGCRLLGNLIHCRLLLSFGFGFQRRVSKRYQWAR
jgi:hypothetical protein